MSSKPRDFSEALPDGLCYCEDKIELGLLKKKERIYGCDVCNTQHRYNCYLFDRIAYEANWEFICINCKSKQIRESLEKQKGK